MKKVHLAVCISFLVFLASAAHAEDLTSLDEPLSNTTDSEVALELGGGEDAFLPYTFSRSNAWGFLPISALILVGLHLLRVPKRKSKRKIDQARRFFSGISGEKTSTGIFVPPKSEKK